MNKKQVAIILGLVCLLLTVGICVQVKTIENAEKEVGKTISGNDGLRDEVLKLREQYNNTYKELEEAEKNLEDARTQAASNNTDDAKKEEELKEINKLLGYTEVTGPGVIIVLDDNRNISEDNIINVSDIMVHEGDLLQIVNELFNAGADAVSINNQRVVSTTEIMCDGNILRINGAVIGVPITVRAIGFPESLKYALDRPGGYLARMRDDGVIVEINDAQSITIPKYEGVYSSEYIK